MSQMTIKPELANITVRTADGRSYRLGKPGTPLFHLRLMRYRLRRRLG